MSQDNPTTSEHVPGVKPARKRGGERAYFSVWDLHAYYGESYIVQGVSFDIHEGEILALLGRNGAGKTSTLRTIARLDNPELKSMPPTGVQCRDAESIELLRNWIDALMETPE